MDIKDSTFTSNTALENFGGAVFSTSDLVVDNCYFENNVAESDGGAIFNSHVPIGHASVFNSKFINNLAKQNSGGAIFNGADLVIGGCYFEKNHAVVSGGAIFSNTRLGFTYDGSTFVENSAPYGGAIYANIFDTYAMNLKFHRNHANSGGAVFIDYSINTHTVSNPYFYNCEFSNNYCDYHLLYENYGGAIYFYTHTKSNSQITFNNCSFNRNNAPTYGGAIYAKENIKFEGEATYFDGNHASDSGGAIYCEGEINFNCVPLIFKSNYAEVYGGAIYTRYISPDMRYLSFINNQVNSRGTIPYKGDGGAIYMYGQCPVDITSCFFAGNTCPGYGGVFYASAKSPLFFECNVFYDNSAGCEGQICYDVGEYGYIGYNYYCNDYFTFKDHFYSKVDGKFGKYHYDENPLRAKVTLDSTNTGINTSVLCTVEFLPTYGEKTPEYKLWGLENYYFSSSSSVNFINYTIGNYSFSAYVNPTQAGDYYIDIFNSKIKSIDFHPKLYVDEDSAPDNKTQIYRNTDYCFNDLQEKLHTEGNVDLEYDYHYMYIDDISKINGVTIGRDVVIDGHGHILDAKHLNSIMNAYLGNIVLKNIVFKNGYEYDMDDGGALFIGDSARVTIINCTFDSNRAWQDGGAIYCGGTELTVINSTFINNQAGGASPLNDCDGGAIHSKAPLTIDNCYFENNVAREDGGAIYATNGLTLENNPSVFYRNVAVNKKGGAIYTNKFNKDVKYASFIENTASEHEKLGDDGGAIYINNENHVTFSQCLFVDNLCSDEGGAIYLDSSSSHLSLINNIFINNRALDEGQSVFNKGFYDQIYNNYWGNVNPSPNNDQLIEWKAISSNIYHSDSDPLKMELILNESFTNPESKVSLSNFFTKSNGDLFTGELFGYSKYIYFRADKNNIDFINEKINNNNNATFDIQAHVDGDYEISAYLFEEMASVILKVYSFDIIVQEFKIYPAIQPILNITLVGNPDYISNREVVVSANNQNYVAYSDDDGKVSMLLDKLPKTPGEYPFSVTSFDLNVKSKFYVLSSINVTDHITKYSKQIYEPFYAIFRDNYGNFLPKGTLVAFMPSNCPLYYSYVENNEGYAKLPNYLREGVYDMQIFNLETKECVYSKFTVLPDYTLFSSAQNNSVALTNMTIAEFNTYLGVVQSEHSELLNNASVVYDSESKSIELSNQNNAKSINNYYLIPLLILLMIVLFIALRKKYGGF